MKRRARLDSATSMAVATPSGATRIHNTDLIGNCGCPMQYIATRAMGILRMKLTAVAESGSDGKCEK